MFTVDFYDIVSEQLKPIIEENKNDSFFKSKDEAGKKSFSFLLWFIKQYNPNLNNVAKYVTDGKDDSSCDIIFHNKDNLGETVYYVVQSKWNAKGNISGAKGVSNEIKACLNDFQLILSGKKERSPYNSKFNEQYERLIEHKENGGRIKFVFLCLNILKHEAHANIKLFINDLVEFEEIDINRLKRDYIEMEYKGARTHNPIEHPYEPKGEIILSVLEDNKINLSHPYKSHIFLVKPKLIHELFSTYGFSLFYKNIRNPLFESHYNVGIIKTIQNQPEQFWYFNNGITAITEKIASFHQGANKVKIHGMQIINGAQTVFSIHDAFHTANSSQKEKINSAYVTLRVIESNNPEFDVDITRYTNSQNPVSERDFRSNDDSQKRLQKDFFDNTNIWYERRRGEFRRQLRGTEKISNEYFAQAYLAYYLLRPVDSKQRSALIFKSKKDGGFYEDIFNEKTSFKHLQIAYYFHDYIENKRRVFKKRFDSVVVGASGNYLKRDVPIIESQFILHASAHILALFNLRFNKVYENSDEFHGKIREDWNLGRFNRWDSIYESIIKKMKSHINKLEQDQAFSLTKYFKSIDTEKNILSLFDS